MISRQWLGLCKPEQADAYIEHLQSDTFPAIRAIAGFVSASILRRTTDRGVEFLVVTRWSSLDAIRQFAGADAETAVVPPLVHGMMIEYDQVVRHYEVVG
ncbi:MAG: antibiotic biosynthesis monooxygenase [Rhizobacter sp.]